MLFDLESKLETLEKKVDKPNVETVIEKDSVSQTSQNNLGCTGEIKCDLCDFVAKNKFGLKIHFHKKHSTATFKCLYMRKSQWVSGTQWQVLLFTQKSPQQRLWKVHTRRIPTVRWGWVSHS